MNERQKFANEIIHWANGGEIQYKNNTDPTGAPWVDFTKDKRSALFNLDHLEWRIKPETLRYQVALMRSCSEYYLQFAVDESAHQSTQNSTSFIKWIEPHWLYVEIDEKTT